MPYLYFRFRDYEWGFDVASGMVPAVGDKVLLEIAMPDCESEECICFTIVERRWGFMDDDEIYLGVKPDEEIPEGHIAHCPSWPATEYSARKQKLERDLERIRRGELP